MNRELVNAICRTFPGAEVSDPWGGGHDAWKVGGIGEIPDPGSLGAAFYIPTLMVPPLLVMHALTFRQLLRGTESRVVAA